MVYLTGFHAIEERLKSCGPGATGPLLMAKPGPRARELVSLAAEKKIRVDRVGTFDLDRLAPDNRGIALAVEDAVAHNTETDLGEFINRMKDRKNALVIILDEITDPHNYGAILRSCDQFGVDLVVSARHRSAKNADIVSKTSAGAVAWVHQAETANLVRAAKDLKDAGFWVYGAEADGEAAYTVNLKGRVAIILGSEGAGISRLLRECCDSMVGIPSSGRLESLNVSVAAGVLLYEVWRQNKING
jgi:23S rRNA (guanosine2251-2'-O)-methyltransferase